ncbi:28S ribosomal protein S28, mitochondrial [Trichogramma pretiosum]|uniref:28S ribosomal protein S28, mitochondrial n=1 Tax=Trichogramma pretiosum TaxID=7493 RepID=UPI0006C99EFC|nr:28S ribosomal protein S28, mitochondrial [Trichogramma pretiosum]
MHNILSRRVINHVLQSRSKLRFSASLGTQTPRALEQQSNQNQSNELINTKTSKPSFSSLLRHSNLIHLGDPENMIVVGQIFEVVNNDLYIDFGWKFHCICSKPVKNNSEYVRGAKVKLKVKSLELSTKFLGATTDVTLLEADCVLMGLISSPKKVTA